jgi:hypothetical protein
MNGLSDRELEKLTEGELELQEPVKSKRGSSNRAGKKHKARLQEKKNGQLVRNSQSAPPEQATHWGPAFESTARASSEPPRLSEPQQQQQQQQQQHQQQQYLYQQRYQYQYLALHQQQQQALQQHFPCPSAQVCVTKI